MYKPCHLILKKWHILIWFLLLTWILFIVNIFIVHLFNSYVGINIRNCERISPRALHHPCYVMSQIFHPQENWGNSYSGSLLCSMVQWGTPGEKAHVTPRASQPPPPHIPDGERETSEPAMQKIAYQVPLRPKPRSAPISPWGWGRSVLGLALISSVVVSIGASLGGLHSGCASVCTVHDLSRALCHWLHLIFVVALWDYVLLYHHSWISHGNSGSHGCIVQVTLQFDVYRIIFFGLLTRNFFAGWIYTSLSTL